MIIRLAAPHDMGRILELGQQMHQEGTYAFLPFEREKVARFAAEYMSDPLSYFFMVAQQDNILIGMMAGTLSDYFFCHEKIACDTVLFIARRYRGGSSAIKLIKAFRAWAEERGARELCLAVSMPVEAKRVGCFYERLGFTRMGGIYKLRL